MTNQQVKTNWKWVLAELLGGNVNNRRHRAKQRDDILTAILELVTGSATAWNMYPDLKTWKNFFQANGKWHEKMWKGFRKISRHSGKPFGKILEMLHKKMKITWKLKRWKRRNMLEKRVYIYKIKYNNIYILYLVVKNWTRNSITSQDISCLLIDWEGPRGTCSCPLAAGLRPAKLRSKDPLAAPKHHGSEGRIGPAAFCAANCQLARVLLQLAFVLHSSGQRTLSQRQNTIAVKDGSGPRPAAAQTAKHHLLKWLETSSKPWLCLPFCTANCQLARVLLQLAFVLRSSGQRTLSQRQNTIAVKDRSGPRPAAQTAKRHLLKWPETSSKLDVAYCPSALPTANLLASSCSWLSSCTAPVKGPSVKDGPGLRPAAQTVKRHLLKWLETSSKPWLYLPFCAANCQLARVLLQLAFVLHSSGQRTLSQRQNTMAVKDGSGLRSADINSKSSQQALSTGKAPGPLGPYL